MLQCNVNKIDHKYENFGYKIVKISKEGQKDLCWIPSKGA